jgi:hypothetical protein
LEDAQATFKGFTEAAVYRWKLTRAYCSWKLTRVYPGGTLEARICREARLEEDDVFFIFDQIARGLRYAKKIIIPMSPYGYCGHNTTAMHYYGNQSQKFKTTIKK